MESEVSRAVSSPARRSGERIDPARQPFCHGLQTSGRKARREVGATKSVTKSVLAAAVAVVLATPALAQVYGTPTGPVVVVQPGAPGVVTRQPGSTGEDGAATYSPTGQAADSIATDSAAAGNQAQPSQVGSTGSGGR